MFRFTVRSLERGGGEDLFHEPQPLDSYIENLRGALCSTVSWNVTDNNWKLG